MTGGSKLEVLPQVAKLLTAFLGEMTIVVTFEEVSGGTEVTILCKNLPPGLRAEDNEAGSRLSLEQLAGRFE
jgi:hypothetical protein